MVRRWLSHWICRHEALDASLLRELRATRKETRAMHSELLEELVAFEGLKDHLEKQLKRMRSRRQDGTFAPEGEKPEELPLELGPGKHPKTDLYRRAREKKAG